MRRMFGVVAIATLSARAAFGAPLAEGEISVRFVASEITSQWVTAGSVMQLPREAERLELVYLPAAALRASLDRVVWEGADPTNVHPDGYGASVALDVLGRRDIHLAIYVRDDGRRDDHTTLPDPLLAEYRLSVVRTNVPMKVVRSLIAYPGSRPAPPLDVNGDFRVNDADFAMLWEAYGHSMGESGFMRLADWDGGGRIDLRDLVAYREVFEAWMTSGRGDRYGNGLICPVSGRPSPYGFAVPGPMFLAETEPPGFEAWTEWTVDGDFKHSGRVFGAVLDAIGSYEVGASAFGNDPLQGDRRTVLIYSTSVASFGGLVVQDGVEYTFEARTDPPGYEDLVQWAASSKYGVVHPASGRGRTFTVRFDGTWGPLHRGSSTLLQWLGVQADNAFLNQDQKQETYIDDFDDGIVPPAIFVPLAGAVLSESGGQLRVVPSGGVGGVEIVSPLSIPSPLSPNNLRGSYSVALNLTAEFSNPSVGTLVMTSLGAANRILEISTLDNVRDSVYLARGDRFGGVLTSALSPFVANTEMRHERRHECYWFPPSWIGSSCSGCIFPPYIWWDFGVFGDALYDGTLNDAHLYKVRLTSAEPFSIQRLELRSGPVVSGTSAWQVSPSHVRTTGGEIATVSGQGAGRLSGPVVRVNGVAAAGVSSVNDQTLVFQVPPGTRGLARVTVGSADADTQAVFSNDVRYFASAQPLLLSRVPLAVGTLGTPYAQEIEASGGSGSYTFSMASGDLPNGVSLSSAGLVSGTPTEAGTFAFFVRAVDPNSEEDLRMFLLRVE